MTSPTKLLNTLWFQLLECPEKKQTLNKMPCFPSSFLTIDFFLQNARNQFSELGEKENSGRAKRLSDVCFFLASNSSAACNGFAGCLDSMQMHNYMLLAGHKMLNV